MLRSNDVGALRTRAIALTSQLSGATAVEQAFDAAFPRPASGETPLTAALSYTLCSRSVVSHSRGQNTRQQVRDALMKIKRRTLSRRPQGLFKIMCPQYRPLAWQNTMSFSFTGWYLQFSPPRNSPLGDALSRRRLLELVCSLDSWRTLHKRRQNLPFERWMVNCFLINGSK